MPDIDSEKFIEHLKGKWGARKCPMCNSGNFNVSENVFELREYKGGGLILGGAPIVPVVPVTCMNCGNTILVNSLVSGVTDSDEKEKKEEDK